MQVSEARPSSLTRHRPVALSMEGDYARAVTVLDETNNVQCTFAAPYILDATELGELLELGKVEHVVGAESQAETGETHSQVRPIRATRWVSPMSSRWTIFRAGSSVSRRRKCRNWNGWNRRFESQHTIRPSRRRA